MTPTADWLDTRDPAPPPAIAGRIRELVKRGASSPDELADAYLRAGERLLGDVLHRDCGARESALDLLVADALVTYAFEMASADPRGLEARAAGAMARIAALAGEEAS